MWEPSKSKPWISLSNLMPIADKLFMIPQKLFRGSVIGEPSWYLNSTSALLRTFVVANHPCIQTFKMIPKGTSMCFYRNMVQRIIVNQLPSKSKNLSGNRFYSLIDLLTSFTVVNTDFFYIKQIFHFPLPDDIINTI